MIELEPLCAIEAQVAPLIVLGATPDGERRVVPITGGRVDGRGPWSGRLSGTIVPGGTDWQFRRDDGALDLEVHYLLRLEDGALVEIRGNGYRHGPADVMERLAGGEDVDPALYYFRTMMRLRTAAPAWDALNRMLAIASARRLADRVLLDVYRIL